MQGARATVGSGISRINGEGIVVLYQKIDSIGRPTPVQDDEMMN